MGKKEFELHVPPGVTHPIDGEEDSGDEHVHRWETGPFWGVTVGVSRCRGCGKRSESSDFAKPKEPPHAD